MNTRADLRVGVSIVAVDLLGVAVLIAWLVLR